MPASSWPTVTSWPGATSWPNATAWPSIPPSAIPGLLLWADGRTQAYSDTPGTVQANPFAGRVRRTNYPAPLTGNAQSPTDPLRPYRETGSFNFEVGAGHYLTAPAASDCSQQSATIACAFTVRDKPEGSQQILLANGSVLQLWAFSANIPSVYYNSSSGFWQPDPALHLPLGSRVVFSVRASATQIKATVVVDGVRTDYSTNVAVAATNLALANWAIGWDGATANDCRLHGTQGQVVVYGRTLADSENGQLVGFLTGTAPARYCPPELPLITVCGDSIARAGFLFYGVPLSQSYLMLAQQTLNATQPVNLINGAISGDLIGSLGPPATNQCGVFSNILLPFYNSSRARQVFFQAAGTNNMAAGNQDGPTTLALSYALMDAAKAAGFRVVGYTILPRIGTGHDAAFETARQYYNTHMLAEYAARGYSAVADVGSIALLQNPADTTYFSDGIHPTIAGHALMAPVVAAALQAAIT